ncbi:putative Chromosome segregation protein Csm1/Pcs1-domain-containing protein [Seiridium unicorne]|uniref:Chromosome segregation protein Csm1/Pcs1-domain-containing protein n=1 Tax=Seiridium unicorne TaxID=138068 RepID=A0ABR2V7F4_9PEZI
MRKANFNALLGLVESEDEDASEILEPVARAVKGPKMPPAKRGRAAAASKATQPAQATANITVGRKALAEKTANLQPEPTRGRGKKRPATEDIETAEALPDDSTVDTGSKPKGPRGRPRGTKAAKISNPPEDSSLVEQPEQPAAQPARRGRKPKAQVATPPMETEIPETQQIKPIDPVEPEFEIPETQQVEAYDALDDSIEDDQVEDLPPYHHAAVSSVQHMPQYMVPSSALRAQHLLPMSTSRLQRHVVPFSASRRPMAASDTEANDPSLRRRIGELTRKYENLEVKYRDLREIGVKEAEHNYDRLKKQGEERANTANQLIETLKAQLAAQTELAKEGQRLKQQLEASEKKAADLQDEVVEASKSLSEAKTEIKSLSTRLAASRTAEASAAKIPSSAMKGNVGDKRLLANAEAAVQSAHMKEDLYADLTGLIVRGFKREKDDEVYDCLQTGRNGTLHFKLAITPDDKSEDLDEAQFLYLPQLDSSRDSDLLEVLPDYLTEEITFPRTHAAKFYSRVMKFLTEKLE